MGERFSHFKANVGWGGIARTVAIGAVVLVFAILNPEPPFSMPVALASLLLPALFRRSLASRPEIWSSVLRKAATGIFLLAIFGQFLKDQVEGVAGLPTALFAVLGLYISLFFWLWSDPDVVRIE